MTYQQDPGSERIDIRDLPPLPLNEGGPVVPPNPPKPEEVLLSFRKAYERQACTSPEEEIRAMEGAARLLSGLDRNAAMRAATWLFDRYGPPMEDGS